MSVATVTVDDENLGVFTQNCLGNLGFENCTCEALCALAIKTVEHSGSLSKSIEEIRERLNVMKANIAGVNQDDLIPQVFLQDELSTLAEKAFNLLQPRWSDIVEYEGSEKAVLNRFRDIPDSLVIARARNLTLDIVAEIPDKFRIVALATGSNVTLLADQVVKTFKPQLVVVRNESLVDVLKEALADVEDKLEFIPSEQGAIEIGFDDVRKHTCK
ncbi:hypothetical protein HYC85_010923 [Camellia sinensis]|uniref:1-deoxy-D-xylulose 5-phosphate reductoisomerase N-terminal domain-containing protein n=1 Tax=Camellia sinensis TaxID=4442 RepID=A0A7J7HJS8_CAMSI|nr:hypothetical protein HYC85_010923 [Camellia sinensis]